MTIITEERFQEVTPEEGNLLFLNGQTFEVLCCPLDVNPKETYTEYKKEIAEALCIALRTKGEYKWKQ